MVCRLWRQRLALQSHAELSSLMVAAQPWCTRLSQAVVCHSGRSTDVGHYFAYASVNGDWCLHLSLSLHPSTQFLDVVRGCERWVTRAARQSGVGQRG